jgi:hypothetical protein
MKIKVLFTIVIMLLFAYVVMAVDSTKPEDHDISWMKRHGQASKVRSEECYSCHIDRVDCIRCHEEVMPRNHTPSWIKRGHGLEASWNRDTCAACHREDSCIECHQTTQPYTHRPGWADPLNRHCQECHYPVQDTTCFTCHKAVHAPNQY